MRYFSMLRLFVAFWGLCQWAALSVFAGPACTGQEEHDAAGTPVVVAPVAPIDGNTSNDTAPAGDQAEQNTTATCALDDNGKETCGASTTPYPGDPEHPNLVNVGPTAEAKLVAVECREGSYAHDLVGMYSPATGRTYWREASYNHSIDGVYSPAEQRFVMSESSYKHDVALVYNPSSKHVDAKEGSYKHRVDGYYDQLQEKTMFVESSYEHGIAALWNQASKKPEVKEGSYAHSLVGVYNPNTQSVEFCESSYRHGIAGYYDSAAKSVKCVEGSYTHGIACVAVYDDGSVIANHSHSPAEDD